MQLKNIRLFVEVKTFCRFFSSPEIKNALRYLRTVFLMDNLFSLNKYQHTFVRKITKDIALFVYPLRGRLNRLNGLNVLARFMNGLMPFISIFVDTWIMCIIMLPS